MATTEIHKIVSTPNLALSYAMSDKIVDVEKVKNVDDEISFNIINIDGKDMAQFKTLTSCYNCNFLEPYKTFSDLQNEWQNVRYNNSKAKDGEPLMWHLTQNFEGFEVTPEVANEIGLKLAEKIFSNYAVVISTHTNTSNIHNHFIISAWGMDGRKWNNSNTNYQRIRSASDELCREYGLRVLEDTTKMKLIKWTDKDGNIHYYEPTDRKNELIEERKKGRASKDDVNSYRNSKKYELENNVRNSNKMEVKNDIDKILPYCRNFNELLEKLRALGYVIKDKKKNGDWLSHISYKSPFQSKPTRDDKLGDGVFYLRVNLEKYISTRNKSFDSKEQYTETNRNLIFVPETKYGSFDISRIDYNYKLVRTDEGYKIVNRTDTEKKIVKDILDTDIKVKGLIDTTRLHRIIKEQNIADKTKKTYVLKNEEDKLVHQIRNSFRCLKYTEEKEIYSYEQLINLYSVSKDKYDSAIENFVFAENSIQKLKDILEIPSKIIQLEEIIDSKKNDVGYILEQYVLDRKQLEDYQSQMNRYKIDKTEGLEKLKLKVADFENRQTVNRNYMSDILKQMNELENCIKTFDRIDTENGVKNIEAMNEFERIAKNIEQKSKNRKDINDDK